MPNVNDMFPSQYLRASDLNGQQPVVTIDKVVLEPVGQERLMKPCVYFQGKAKAMVLNKTNSKKIADITGSSNTEDWTGLQIKLYATEVEYQGETMEGLRVRAPNAAVRQPVVRAAVDESDIPF